MIPDGGVGLARWILAGALVALAVLYLLLFSSQDMAGIMYAQLLLTVQPLALIALGLGIAWRIRARRTQFFAFTRLDWVLVGFGSVVLVGGITFYIWLFSMYAPTERRALDQLDQEGRDARATVQRFMHAVALRDVIRIRSLVGGDSVAASYTRSSRDSAAWARFAAAPLTLREISVKEPDTLHVWYSAPAEHLGCSRVAGAEVHIGFTLVRDPPTWRVAGKYPGMYPEPGTC